MSKLSEDDIINAWRHRWEMEMDSIYLYDSRKPMLEDLADYFYNNNIKYEDVKLCKRQIVEIIVTKDGMKGRGKHKGWKERASKDFDGFMSDRYVDLSKNKREEGMNPKTHYLKNDSIIKWLDNKYVNYNEAALNEAHRIGSGLNLQFLEETFNLRMV